MTLKLTIQEQLKSAMKGKDEARVATLRMLVSAIKNEEISALKREDGLNDEETRAVVARQIKQRRDSIEQFTKGARADLAEKEKAELAILQEFMPAELGEEEIRAVIKEVKESGASALGVIIGQVMGRLKGKADGNLVRKIVEAELQ